MRSLVFLVFGATIGFACAAPRSSNDATTVDRSTDQLAIVRGAAVSVGAIHVNVFGDQAQAAPELGDAFAAQLRPALERALEGRGFRIDGAAKPLVVLVKLDVATTQCRRCPAPLMSFASSVQVRGTDARVDRPLLVSAKGNPADDNSQRQQEHVRLVAEAVASAVAADFAKSALIAR